MKLPKLRELKEALKSVFSKPYTTKYPFGPAKIHPRFRGRPAPQDSCVGCTGCASYCPAGAIEIADDIENKNRAVIWHYDICIMCGECERICTVGDGVKMVPEFELAGFDRAALIDKSENELVLCDSCGEVIGTKAHILWMMSKTEEKQAASLPYVITKMRQIDMADDVDKEISLDKRDDLFALTCPKCRHQVILYDAQ